MYLLLKNTLPFVSIEGPIYHYYFILSFPLLDIFMLKYFMPKYLNLARPQISVLQFSSSYSPVYFLVPLIWFCFHLFLVTSCCPSSKVSFIRFFIIFLFFFSICFNCLPLVLSVPLHIFFLHSLVLDWTWLLITKLPVKTLLTSYSFVSSVCVLLLNFVVLLFWLYSEVRLYS